MLGIRATGRCRATSSNSILQLVPPPPSLQFNGSETRIHVSLPVRETPETASCLIQWSKSNSVERMNERGMIVAHRPQRGPDHTRQMILPSAPCSPTPLLPRAGQRSERVFQTHAYQCKESREHTKFEANSNFSVLTFRRKDLPKWMGSTGPNSPCLIRVSPPPPPHPKGRQLVISVSHVSMAC